MLPSRWNRSRWTNALVRDPNACRLEDLVAFEGGGTGLDDALRHPLGNSFKLVWGGAAVGDRGGRTFALESCRVADLRDDVSELLRRDGGWDACDRL